MYILISFLISIFIYLLRLHLVVLLGLALSGVFSSMLVFVVLRPFPPFNPVAERGEALSSVPNEEGHEATSQPTGVMEQATPQQTPFPLLQEQGER